MKRWTACLGAAALLALSGCGLWAQEAESPAGLLETAAGLTAQCPVAEVDGIAISSRCYLYWLGRNCAYLAERLTAQGREVRWEQGTEGETLGDSAKAAALQAAALYTLLPALAEEAGILPADEDEAAIQTSRQQHLEALGGESAWARELGYWGLEEEDAHDIALCHRLYQRLYEYTRGTFTAEALSAHAEAQGLVTVSYLAYPEDAAAQAALAAIRGSDDPASLLASRGETAAACGCVTLGDGASPLPEAVCRAAESLSPGELSVTAAEGLSYLLLRQEIDPEGAARSLFDARLRERAESAQLRLLSVYDAITPETFFPALTAAQAALKSAA